MGFLDLLKEDPNCLYIYNWGPYIYGLSKEPTEYLVVVSKNWKSKYVDLEDFYQYAYWRIDDTSFHIYSIDFWFQKVLNSDIDCWECACMNKKFIIKEHVKLMMSTDLLKLRVFVDTHDFDNWETIKNCKFANQIIDNHKIVNFKEANDEYELLKENPTKEQFEHLFKKTYDLLRSRTDEILRRSKIEKILQKQKND